MKKAIVLFLIFLLIGVIVFAQQKLAGTYDVDSRNFYPEDKNILVKLFGSDSLAPFMIKGKDTFEEGNNRVGFIDSTGLIVIKPDYTNCSYFFGDYAEVLQSIGNQYKLGVIDRSGRIIIPIAFSGIGRCLNRLLMVRKGKNISFVNFTGEVVVPFDVYSDFATPPPVYFEADDTPRGFLWYLLQPGLVQFGGYIGVRKGNKWAVIDSTGVEIIPPRFDGIGIFNKDVATVKIGQKTGVINSDGDMLVPTLYDDIKLTGKWFVYATLGGKTGVLSLDNKVIVPLAYLRIERFSEGYIAYNLENKAALYDAKGKLVSGVVDNPNFNFPFWGQEKTGFFVYNSVDKKFHPYENILDRRADRDYKRQLFFQRNKKWGIMDTAGREITPPLFDQIDYEKLNYLDDDKHKLIAVKLNGKWGIVNKKGEMLLPFDYDQFVVDRDKLLVRKGGKCGLLDNNLAKLTEIKYDSLLMTHAEDQFDNYRDSTFFISAQVNKKWGLLNNDGKEVTLFKYDHYLRFYHHLAFVTIAGKYGVINSNGKQIADCVYDNITFIKDTRGVYFYRYDGQLLIRKNGLYGVIRSNGTQVVPPIYNDVARLHYPWAGKYQVTFKGKAGIFDGTTQKMIVPCEYSDLNFYVNYRTDKTGYYSYTIAKKDGYYGLLDTAGKIRLPIKYDRIYIDPQNNCYVYLNDDQQIFDDNLKLIVPTK